MKFKLFNLLTVLLLFCLPFVMAFAPIPVTLGDFDAPPSPLTAILTLAVGFASLVGVSKFVAILVQIFKLFGIVTDGTASRWAGGLNLLMFIALVYFSVFQPQITASMFDGYAGQIASIAVFVLGFVVQITGSKPAYDQLRASNIPLLSFSHSRTGA